MKFLALCLTLFLADCATKPPDGGIKDVQVATVQLCQYLPLAQTVADIFLAGNVLVSTTASMAGAICDAVTTRPLADGPKAVPKVNGIVVRGRFVR